MNSHHASPVPMSAQTGGVNAAMQRHWRNWWHLSSALNHCDAFLGEARQDRAPWLIVAFIAGIAAWFALSGPAQWIAFVFCTGLIAILALASWRHNQFRANLLLAILSMCIAAVAGLALIWARSAMIGTPPLAHPVMGVFDARVLERVEQPAQERVRLILATRNPDDAMPMKIRVNLPDKWDSPELAKGAVIRVKVRLMPPAPPMLPGAYNFARAAWFQGFAATGSVIGPVSILKPAEVWGGIAQVQQRLSAHVRAQLSGSSGTIAAAFASGDRGAIATADAEAMRDAGLTHLLSISGLHVSAVIAGVYLIALRLLAFWPWLALRMRLPVVAAALAAIGGVGYTLLTGAQVPTVRACAAAILVLLAMALGREPLSLRLVGVAALFVLLLWPESLVGPSFQMSFAAVIAIIALHGAAPVRAFLADRDETWWQRTGRRAVMLLLTGVVIELALMPIVLFHFHRAGVYGALANVVAIPLTTFVSMPLIAIALLLDGVGLGAPAWWLVGKSLDLLLWIAHTTATQPGAVNHLGYMPVLAFALCVGGSLWLALWRGSVRLAGLVPVAVGTLIAIAAPQPHILVTADGRHVGLVGLSSDGSTSRLYLLRQSHSDYVRDNLAELSGVKADAIAIDQWPGARCSADFCTVQIAGRDRQWTVLMARSRDLVTERALHAACQRADIVVADRGLPQSCRPRWLKADRRLLSRTGGIALSLDPLRIRTVAQQEGHHGWWRSGSGS
ncbi:MAG: ComEC/Rec2 family competence protein [Novosphingobium sp.]